MIIIIIKFNVVDALLDPCMDGFEKIGSNFCVYCVECIMIVMA